MSVVLSVLACVLEMVLIMILVKRDIDTTNMLEEVVYKEVKTLMNIYTALEGLNKNMNRMTDVTEYQNKIMQMQKLIEDRYMQTFVYDEVNKEVKLINKK